MLYLYSIYCENIYLTAKMNKNLVYSDFELLPEHKTEPSEFSVENFEINFTRNKTVILGFI